MWIWPILLLLASCDQPSRTGSETVLVFKHFKLPGDPAPLSRLLRDFERAHPGIRVRQERLPASSDEQHQFYAINLSAGSTDFDVFAIDVIWVAEFARAGWLRDVTPLIKGHKGDFFAGPLAAVQYEGKAYAIPWFVDTGVLYYRADLLAEHGLDPPRTWQEMEQAVRLIRQRHPALYGYVWQGKQYEGLVCNVLEVMHSNGGGVLSDGQVVLDQRANVQALGLMRDWIAQGMMSPELVLNATEEPSRRVFGDGKAIFLRNWPYAWKLFEQPDSRVKGRVGVAPLPSFDGHQSAGTLGGWQLGVNRLSANGEAAEKLVRFLASPKAQRVLATHYGLNPSRRSLYSDPAVLAAQPHLGLLKQALESARPRPVHSRYIALSLILQSEFSGALAGLRSPAEALGSAHEQLERWIVRDD